MYNKLMFKSFKYYATYNIMPFHRNIERKAIKRYGQYKKCAGYVAHDASKALAMAKYLKGIVNVEFKPYGHRYGSCYFRNALLDPND